MCTVMDLLFTYLYVMYDEHLNICSYIFTFQIICNLSCKLVVFIALSITLVFSFYQKTETELLGF